MTTVDLFGTVVVSTEMAVLMDFGGDEAVWVPKSVIVSADGVEGYFLEFVDGVSEQWLIAEWWAHREGLV